MAAIIASEQNTELVDCFVKTGRMRELVSAFATTSKDMVIMTEDKRSPLMKKRGAIGETVKIWDVNARN